MSASAKKPRTRVISLNWPFEFEGREITEVTIYRPKLSHIRAINEVEDGESEFDRGTRMLTILSDLPQGALDDLDVEDFTALSEAIGAFFPERQQADGDQSLPKPPTGSAPH